MLPQQKCLNRSLFQLVMECPIPCLPGLGDFIFLIFLLGVSQVCLVIKNVPANAGETGDLALILGSGRSPGRGNGSPFQGSCLGNPMDRGTWQATVHGVTKSQTQQLSRHIFLLSDFLCSVFIFTMMVNDCLGTVLILLLMKSSTTCLVQFLQPVQGCLYPLFSVVSPMLFRLLVRFLLNPMQRLSCS